MSPVSKRDRKYLNLIVRRLGESKWQGEMTPRLGVMGLRKKFFESEEYRTGLLT